MVGQETLEPGGWIGMQSETPSTPLSLLPKSSSPLLRLNTIAPYYTMFKLQFPFDALAHAPEGARVLDPFCGRGTTLFAARLRGLAAVGIDSNPVAAAIASAKLVDVRAEAVVTECRRILEEADGPKYVPAGEFWEMCYHKSTLESLCKLREAFPALEPTPVREVLKAIILGILHGPITKAQPSYLSNQMPRTYSTKPSAAVRYWRKNNIITPPEVDLLSLVERRARFVLAETPPAVSGRVVLGDSRNPSTYPDGIRFDYVITSPPYIGMDTYVPDQWLRRWFLGGGQNVDYSRQEQVGKTSRKGFVSELAKVWSNVADVCNPGATMVVRFGRLPSMKDDPESVLLETLSSSGRTWRAIETRSAGKANDGHRQAEQFVPEVVSAVEEIDLHVELGG